MAESEPRGKIVILLALQEYAAPRNARAIPRCTTTYRPIRAVCVFSNRGICHQPASYRFLRYAVAMPLPNFRQSGIGSIRTSICEGAMLMGKYVLGWIMGVPVVVLVVLYLIFN